MNGCKYTKKDAIRKRFASLFGDAVSRLDDDEKNVVGITDHIRLLFRRFIAMFRAT